jgi:hypothetical protein
MHELALISLETYYTFPKIESSKHISRCSMDKGKTWKLIEKPEGSYTLNQINTS